MKQSQETPKKSATSSQQRRHGAVKRPAGFGGWAWYTELRAQIYQAAVGSTMNTKIINLIRY
jgi:hypothetical protein